MNIRAMVYVGKDIDRATIIVNQRGGTVLANYGQSILIRIADTELQALRDAGYRVRELLEQPVVNIGGFALDTSRPSAISTAETALEMALPSGRSHHVVRLIGPMHPDWSTQLERMGAIILEGFAADQYLVTLESAKLPEVQALGFVESISPYYAALKINPALLTTEVQNTLPALDALKHLTIEPSEEESTEGVPTGIQNVDELLRPKLEKPELVGNLEIVVFDGENRLEVVDAIRALGVKIIQEGDLSIIVFAHPSLIASIASNPRVRQVNPYNPPALTNNVATGIIHADTLHNDHGLNGTGQIIGIADTGLDTGVNDASMHDDFEGRIVSIYALGRPGDASDIHNHGTHVAGSVIGDGALSNGKIRGMAPAAKIVFQSTMDAGRHLGGLPANLGSGIFSVARGDGAHIHTNSWSLSPTYGAYLEFSRQCDEFAFNNREFLILFSAGNDAPFRVNAPATAKNVLTVGASESVRPLPTTLNFQVSPMYPSGVTILNFDDRADDKNDVAFFSCPGPAQNNRIKPDVVAPGSWILSARSSVSTDDCGPDGIGGTGDEDGVWTHAEAVGHGLPNQPFYFGGDQNTPDVPAGSGPAAADNYCYMNGTSMATPITAGSCALLRQYLIEQRGHTPSAALLKALIINGAADMGMGVPDDHQGWGRVDLTNTLFPSATLRVQFDDTLGNAVATGDIRTYDVHVSSMAEPLVVTLVWRDPPGATIQNKLHLRVINVASGVESAADDISNILNNVQKVIVKPPQLGTYRIEVEGVNVTKGINKFKAVQDYALVVSNASGFSCKPSDVVQVIDRSGSMGYSGYMEPAKERAKQMIDLLQINDRAGLVSFSASAVEDIPLTNIDSQYVKEYAHHMISQISSGGMTDLREGLECGLATLGADAGRPRAIVFISDGYHTDPPPYVDNQFLDDIAAANVRVFTIALGPASDFGVLNNIASRTGTGAVYTVESAADIHKLQEIYYNISGGLGCGGIVHLNSTLMSAGDHLEQQAEVNRIAREALFVVAWPQTKAEIVFTLKSPSGKMYNSRTPEFFFFQGSSHAFYRITRPEPGTWRLIVDYKGGVNQPLLITTAAMADSDVRCQASIDTKYLYNDKVLLSLIAKYGDQPLTGGKVTAIITFPTKSIDDLLVQYAANLEQVKIYDRALQGDKVDLDLMKLGIFAAQAMRQGKDIYEREQIKIELTDDGLEADPKADDGIYTAFFNPKAAGVAGNYMIQVFFDVTNKQLGHHRYTRLIPVYVPRPEKPVEKLIIKEILIRRNILWRYSIIGARILMPDGSPATPAKGVSVKMVLNQASHQLRSTDLPYYRLGDYYIWRCDWKRAKFSSGYALVNVQASTSGLLAAQTKQRIVL